VQTVSKLLSSVAQNQWYEAPSKFGEPRKLKQLG